MQFNLKLQNDFKNNIRREWALTQCHLDKDYTKNSVYRNMYPVLFL